MASVKAKIRDDKCGCTGSRSCIMCESYRDDKFILNKRQQASDSMHTERFYYCAECGNKAWSYKLKSHDEHFKYLSDDSRIGNEEKSTHIPIEGITIISEVISPSEEAYLVEQIDSGQWINSQSGRRKQDYGPKVNFKKQKVSYDNFKGFPLYLRDIWTRLRGSIRQLNDFQAIELCHLEYHSERGSSIEPHFDDFWIWGERLVTLNYLSTAVLTLTHASDECLRDVEIAVDMPARSLLIVHSDARYKWHHGIKRSDVNGRRMATTWREFTPAFLPGGDEFHSIGREILKISSNYY